MAELLTLSNLSKPKIILCVENYSSFWLKFKGLMLQKEIQPGFGVMFQDETESRLNSAIHMLFMNFDIAVFWVNKKNIIVDKRIARAWNLFYLPASPACITIETHSSHYGDFNIGDQITFE